MIVVRIQGGLGNQMFQYALYKSLKNRGKDVKIDTSSYLYTRAHNGYELEKVFDISPEYVSEERLFELTGVKNKNLKNVILNRLYKSFQLRSLSNKVYYKKYDYIYIEREHKYNPEIFLLDNVYLDGWWQNYRYFAEIEQSIRNDFIFRIEKENKIDYKNKEILNEIKRTNSVSIHVRRGDYLKSSSLGNICGPEYYNKAISLLKEKIDNPIFFVFSDDIDYCRKYLALDNARYIDWNNSKNSFKDMYLMSKCKHNIIANSSFSWWGAFLNNNPGKIVIMPKQWFRNKYTEINNMDWIKI